MMDRSDHSSAISGPNTQRILKLAVAVCFLLLSYALFALKLPETPGYEISIYANVDKLVWVAVILSIFVGLLIVIYNAFKVKNGSFWLIGLLLCIFSFYIAYIFPHIRGLLIADTGDPLVHLSWMQSQLTLGGITDNPYPFSHLLFIELHLISNVSLQTLVDYTLPFISLLYVIFIVLLGRLISPHRSLTLIIAALSIVPIYGKFQVVFYPNSFPLLLMPVLVYCYFLGDSFPVQGRVCLIIWLLAYPFIYAPVALVVIISLVGMEIARAYLRRTGPLNTEMQTERFTYNPALISFIAFFIWSSTFPVFNTGVKNAYSWLIGETILNPQMKVIENLIVPLGREQIILLILKTYGINIIYGILSIIAGLYLLRYLFLKEKLKTDYIRKFIIIFVAFLFAIPLGLAIYATMLCVAVGRIVGLNYSMWATPLLAGFIIFVICKSISKKWLNFLIIFLVLVITGLSTLGIFTVHRTPFTNQPFLGATYLDTEGIRWFINYMPTDFMVTVRGIDFQSLANYGTSEANRYPEWTNKMWYIDTDRFHPPTSLWPLTVPQHFGYLTKEHFGDWYGLDNYFIITKRFVVASPLIGKLPGFFSVGGMAEPGFDGEDFERFDNADPTVSRLYSNGEFWIYRIKGGTAIYKIPAQKP